MGERRAGLFFFCFVTCGRGNGSLDECLAARIRGDGGQHRLALLQHLLHPPKHRLLRRRGSGLFTEKKRKRSKPQHKQKKKKKKQKNKKILSKSSITLAASLVLNEEKKPPIQTEKIFSTSNFCKKCSFFISFPLARLVWSQPLVCCLLMSFQQLQQTKRLSPCWSPPDSNNLPPTES